MTKHRPPPPVPEDLAELYLDLKRRLEKLEGSVKQLLAEQTQETALRPTWRDFQKLQTEIENLKRYLSG
jgi:hypothetical protein